MFANDMIAKVQMVNTLIPDEKLVVGGQPTIDDLKLLHSFGVKQVVNLRGICEENHFDESQILEELGVEYHTIPVTDISTFTKECAEKLKGILALNQPTLIHCASGNRVGALITLQAFWFEGFSAQEALDKGIQAGLTQLKAQISQLIGL
jgi:protein tyrosine phosphatase (PTP) superfamily phosphohydrolase (DUF442 family)